MQLHDQRFLVSHSDKILFLMFNLILNLFQQILFRNNHQKFLFTSWIPSVYFFDGPLEWACLCCVRSTLVSAQACPCVHDLIWNP